MSLGMAGLAVTVGAAHRNYRLIALLRTYPGDRDPEMRISSK